ncbi:MAG: hypothetical protein EA371_11415 [Gammaproteobacteria bacterium]|nr:MAG: hypothetical protein EA371_11415 [Gammaproteobacteria bacterium]
MDMSVLETVKRTRFGDIENVNSGLLDWQEVEGQPGNYIKVLVIDDKNHRVDFLFKQDPNKEFARHTHLCTAVAFTLEGLWGYREGEELHFPGTFSYEPPGSAHTPYSTDQGMMVYASFQGSSPDMLEILDDDDNVVAVLTLDFFRQYYDG